MPPDAYIGFDVRANRYIKPDKGYGRLPEMGRKSIGN